MISKPENSEKSRAPTLRVHKHLTCSRRVADVRPCAARARDKRPAIRTSRVRAAPCDDGPHAPPAAARDTTQPHTHTQRVGRWPGSPPRRPLSRAASEKAPPPFERRERTRRALRPTRRPLQRATPHSPPHTQRSGRWPGSPPRRPLSRAASEKAPLNERAPTPASERQAPPSLCRPHTPRLPHAPQ